jgi:DNA repair exonuclease SbcCD ATPase subunit
VSLSQRVRPNSEAAPWVIDEIKALEARIAELERDRDFWHEQAVKLPEQIAALEDERDALHRRLGEAEKDTQRLDWLADPSRAVRVMANTERTSWHVVDISNGLSFISRSMITMRAAIDAALSTHPSAGMAGREG